MLAYKNVYKNENGVLVRNAENKIEYVDTNGKRRVKTNPTYNDFEKVGLLRKKYVEKMPDYDVTKQCVKEVFCEKDGYFEISFKIENIEVTENEEAN